MENINWRQYIQERRTNYANTTEISNFSEKYEKSIDLYKTSRQAEAAFNIKHHQYISGLITWNEYVEARKIYKHILLNLANKNNPMKQKKSVCFNLERNTVKYYELDQEEIQFKLREKKQKILNE
jgi:hypothetical protein